MSAKYSLRSVKPKISSEEVVTERKSKRVGTSSSSSAPESSIKVKRVASKILTEDIWVTASKSKHQETNSSVQESSAKVRRGTSKILTDDNVATDRKSKRSTVPASSIKVKQTASKRSKELSSFMPSPPSKTIEEDIQSQSQNQSENNVIDTDENVRPTQDRPAAPSNTLPTNSFNQSRDLGSVLLQEICCGDNEVVSMFDHDVPAPKVKSAEDDVGRFIKFTQDAMKLFGDRFEAVISGQGTEKERRLLSAISCGKDLAAENNPQVTYDVESSIASQDRNGFSSSQRSSLPNKAAAFPVNSHHSDWQPEPLSQLSASSNIPNSFQFEENSVDLINRSKVYLEASQQEDYPNNFDTNTTSGNGQFDFSGDGNSSRLSSTR